MSVDAGASAVTCCEQQFGLIDMYLNGSFRVCRTTFAKLHKPGASVINISAVQPFMPTPWPVHVCAAKAGIEVMTRVLATEQSALRRYASIDEIANVAVLLASSLGANFNGEAMVCDGRQSLPGGGSFACAQGQQRAVSPAA